jgi:hypothetical protein
MTRWLARQLWWIMLWLIRRPSSRRLQKAVLNLVPTTKRESARASMIKQERFARRIGLPLLTFVIRLFFLSVTMTVAILVILNGVAEGWLIIPTQDWIESSQAPSR